MTNHPSKRANENDAEARLGFLLHDASRLMRRRFEKRASGYGLSSAQWRLLVRVFKEEGVAQARLAEILEIEPISVSRLIDRMENGGWIERRQDSSDRRVRTIYLTENSRDIFESMRGLATQIFDYAMTGLSPQERLMTINGLKTIIDNLGDDERFAAALQNIEKAPENVE